MFVFTRSLALPSPSRHPLPIRPQAYAARVSRETDIGLLFGGPAGWAVARVAVDGAAPFDAFVRQMTAARASAVPLPGPGAGGGQAPPAGASLAFVEGVEASLETVSARGWRGGEGPAPRVAPPFFTAAEEGAGIATGGGDGGRRAAPLRRAGLAAPAAPIPPPGPEASQSACP